jgi:hypothetical protein
MDSYPHVFGLNYPFVLVNDLDAHRLMACFANRAVKVTAREGGRDLTRFDFPGRNRASVDLLMQQVRRSTVPHTAAMETGWKNPHESER